MEWVTIPNFSKYEINLQGQVRNIRTKQILSQRLDKKGYYVLALTNDNEMGTTKALHRLLMETFKPMEGMDKLTVNHINHVKTDNQLDNLEWLTNRENVKEAYAAGLHEGTHIGGNNRKAVKCVETGEVFESARAAAKHVGISSDGKIGDAAKNSNRTCGGFHWCYALPTIPANE